MNFDYHCRFYYCKHSLSNLSWLVENRSIPCCNITIWANILEICRHSTIANDYFGNKYAIMKVSVRNYAIFFHLISYSGVFIGECLDQSKFALLIDLLCVYTIYMMRRISGVIYKVILWKIVDYFSNFGRLVSFSTYLMMLISLIDVIWWSFR